MKNKLKIQSERINVKKLRVYVLGGVCIVLAGLCIFMTIGMSASGSQMADLESKETALLAKKQDLEQSLVSALSVNNLSQESTNLGFVKVDTLVYVTNAEALSSTKPVAQLP